MVAFDCFVAACSKVGEVGTAVVAVLVGEVRSSVLEDGSGVAVDDVRDSVGDVLTVRSVELRGWVV